MQGGYIDTVYCLLFEHGAANDERQQYLAPRRGSPAFAPDKALDPAITVQPLSQYSKRRPLRHWRSTGTDISAGNSRAWSKRGATPRHATSSREIYLCNREPTSKPHFLGKASMPVHEATVPREWTRGVRVTSVLHITSPWRPSFRWTHPCRPGH